MLCFLRCQLFGTSVYHSRKAASLVLLSFENEVTNSLRCLSSHSKEMAERKSSCVEVKLSAKYQPGPSSFVKDYFVGEPDVSKHKLGDVGQMYTIPPQDFQRLLAGEFRLNGFTMSYMKLADTLKEASMIIRQPGLEIVNYLKHTDYASPINRYLVYGGTGSGKTMTLQYVTHYCMQQGWLIIPCYRLYNWLTYTSRFKPKQKQELYESFWNKERIDIPHRAVWWLDTFRCLNSPLLDGLKTSQEYSWSKHDSSPAGTSFMTLLDLGKSRSRYATDIIGCIMKEVREQDHSTMPKTLVVADCVNAVFGETRLKHKHGVRLGCDQLAYLYNLKKLLRSTWSNGAVILATNSNHDLSWKNNIKGSHPYDLLGVEGFNAIDPHIPMQVGRYTDQEVLTLLAYYRDRKWLTGRSLTAAGENEIIQLSCNNPADLAYICSHAY